MKPARISRLRPALPPPPLSLRGPGVAGSPSPPPRPRSLLSNLTALRIASLPCGHEGVVLDAYKQLDKLTEVEIIKAELEERQFKVKLTVIDTPGFGDYVNNRDSWLPIVEFIDDQHEAYMRQEQQPQRHEKTDLKVHACL